MTKIDLKAIAERAEKLPSEEWKVTEKGNTVKSLSVVSVAYEGEPMKNICSGISPKTQYAKFIAHARQDIPALLDYIAKLETVAEAARIHVRSGRWRDNRELRKAISSLDEEEDNAEILY